MKISPAQIEKLYLFTKSHHLEHYDLQSEMVNHLANDIENQWLENSKISFEDALNKAFRKFGIFGFEEVTAQKTKELQKKYYKWFWQQLYSFFKLPEIIGTFTAIFLVYKLLELGLENDIFNIIFMLSFLFSFISILLIFFLKYYKKKKDIIWLMEEIIFRQSNGIFLIISGIIPQIIGYLIPTNNFYILFLVSFLTIVLVLTNFIVYIKIPKNATTYLLQTYPYIPKNIKFPKNEKRN